MLDADVKQHVETYIKWRKEELFDTYKEIVMKRLNKMKKNPAAIALQDPNKVAKQDPKLDSWYSDDIYEAARLFEDQDAVRIHVPLDEQEDVFRAWFQLPHC